MMFSYRFGHILRTIKALQSSTKTSLRIDEDGLLSLQFLMPSSKPRAAGGTDAFIEFRVRNMHAFISVSVFIVKKISVWPLMMIFEQFAAFVFNHPLYSNYPFYSCASESSTLLILSQSHSKEDTRIRPSKAALCLELT